MFPYEEAPGGCSSTGFSDLPQDTSHAVLWCVGAIAQSVSPGQSISGSSLQLQRCSEASLNNSLAVQAWAIVQQYTAPVLRAVPPLNFPVRYVSRWFMPPQ